MKKKEEFFWKLVAESWDISSFLWDFKLCFGSTAIVITMHISDLGKTQCFFHFV